MALPRPPRAVIFDMDGLLVDTETVVFRAMNRASAPLGRDMPMPVFQRMVGLTHAHSDAIVLEHYGADFDLAAWNAEVSAHFRAKLTTVGIPLKAGAPELLDHLDELDLPRAIATSSNLASVRASLGPHGLVDRFHALITRDVQTQGKPHPEPFLKAAAALGVDPADCLALEDSHNGVRAAAAAGMMTVMVPDMLHPTDEMHSLCVRIAIDLHEVRQWLPR
jgi:HAD superfamily hydrolase (TIGR01509 family)